MKCKIDTNDLILFTSAIYDRGIFWTIPNSFNGLIGINAETGRVTEVIPLYGKKTQYYDRLIRAFSTQDSMFFLPARRNELIKIKCDTKEIEYIPLPVLEECAKEAIFCNGYLCMFLSKIKKVVVVDIENMDIKMEIDLGSIEILDGKEMWSLFWTPIIYNEKVYIACQNTNSFLMIDLKIFQWDLVLHNDMQDGIQDICVGESHIFLLGINGSIKKINVETGFEEFICAPDEIHCKYSRIIHMNGKLWLLPEKGSEFSIVTKERQKRPIYTFSAVEAKSNVGVKTSTYEVIDEYIYVYPRTRNSFIIINTKTLECEKMDLEFSREIKEQIRHEKYYNLMFHEGENLIHNGALDLENYIQLVCL